MRFQRFIPTSLCLTFVLSLLAPTQNVQGGLVTYAVSIDTSSISGTAGDIEFQLGSAGDGVPITASITGYSSDASLNGSTGYLIAPNPPYTTMTGDLAADTLSLFNDDSASQIADADQLVNSFGGYMNFLVSLSGDSIGNPSTSTPTLSIFVYSGSTPLGNGSLGELATFQVNRDGTVTVTYDRAVSSVAPVPEPATIASFGIGIIGLAFAMRRRRVHQSSQAL